MLKRFEVQNYKGFKAPLIWDLSKTRDYSYKKNLVENKLVKYAVVYGKNSTGKSSLCTAVMDITSHLLDVQKDNTTPAHAYKNLESSEPCAHFKYVFQFDEQEVTYEYKKTSQVNLTLERVFVGKKKLLEHDFTNEAKNFIKIPGAENLRTTGLQNSLSVLKFAYNNTIQDENSVITKIMEFVKGMLYFRSLQDSNKFIGYKANAEIIQDVIIKKKKLEDFSQFLAGQGVRYKLVPISLPNGMRTIGVQFKNGNTVDFNSISSSGTKMMLLFYFWMMDFDKLTFLVIDEFDAYYHYKTSAAVLKYIYQFSNLQSLVSTHNVTLMNTELTRPDCCFIISNKGINNLCNCTEKELREAHNIEKMYRQGDFIE